MSNLMIRSLGEGVKERLRVRAAQHGRSMEEEAREILRAAIAHDESTPPKLGEAIRQLFAPLGGIELELPPREIQREPPRFK